MTVTTPSPIETSRVTSWTPRQREVLTLLARGRTNREIAEELGISLDGAKWHVSEIITRLGARPLTPAEGRKKLGLKARG